MSGSVGFAQGRERVGGLAGLRDDHDGTAAAVLLRAVGVLACVFDVDDDSAKVFEQQLADKAGVAAGTAGGDDDFATRPPSAKLEWAHTPGRGTDCPGRRSPALPGAQRAVRGSPEASSGRRVMGISDRS